MSRSPDREDPPFLSAIVAGPLLRLRAVLAYVSLKEFDMSVYYGNELFDTHDAGAVVALASLSTVARQMTNTSASVAKT